VEEFICSNKAGSVEEVIEVDNKKRRLRKKPPFLGGQYWTSDTS
jgi:hypothetical protein